MIAILFIIYILSVVSELERLVSTKIRDNKLIAIYQPSQSNNIKVRVFELKDGATTDIINNRKTFEFSHAEKDFTLVELDKLDGLKEGKNRLWVRFEYQRSSNEPIASSFANSVGYINLDDMSLKTDSSFIKFPTHESFPIKGYTVNSITNELGSFLYITGGEIYSKKDKSFLVSNSFYKYNFTSKEWVDMSYTAENSLKPLTSHKSVVVDNRYLVILGGTRKNINNPMFNHDVSDRSIFEFNSLYNLNIFDTFTNSWESVNIKADIFDTNIATIQFINFIETVYKNKIIVFGGYTGESGSNAFRLNEYLGILDLKSKSWTWSPILNEDGSSYKPYSQGGDIQVLNDQLIICTDVFEGESYKSIQVFDIPSHRMKSTLRLSDSSHSTESIKETIEAQNQSKIMPTYAIVLIAVSCTLFLAALGYLLYRKIKKNSISKDEKTENNEPILEVWANPDIDNTLVDFGRDGNLY